MTIATEALAERYGAALRDFVERGGESSLSRAYDFGRLVVDGGASILDLVAIHHEVLAGVVQAGDAAQRDRLARVADFLVEVVSPMEMALRGYKSANVALMHANEALERQNVAVREAQAAAEAANRDLESFSYSVAHDLRAPLRTIDAFSASLAQQHAGRLDVEGLERLALIRSSAEQMSAMIASLLALSRVTHTGMRRERVDLTLLARAALLRLQRSQPERRVDVVIADGIEAEGDAALLGIVLDNLLGNAWKFTGKRDRARIEFACERDGGRTVYVVRDDGAGFSMQHADRLFGVFNRLHRDSEFEGTGIGLATVQRIVQRHRGRIWAEGAVDAGAAFRFTLDEAAAPVRDPRAGARSRPAARPGPARERG